MWRLILFGFVLLFSSCHREKPQNHLRLNLSCEPPTLDPRKATDATSMNVLIMLFEGLTRFDEHDKPALAGAESVEISEDGCTYTFRLREQLWSSGIAVTAHDYVQTWRSLLDPLYPSPFAYKFFCIEGAKAVKMGASPQELGVKAIDRKTLRISLRHPVPYFLDLLALPTFFPLCMQEVNENPHWADSASLSYISNGPFKMVDWVHESEITLKKNPFYWDERNVNLDGVDLYMVPDLATELYMFERGELDWAGSPLSGLPLEFIPQLCKERKLNIYSTNGVYYYKINTEVPPLNNRKVRRALAMAIDRQSIVDHILQANQTIATSLVPHHPQRQLFKDKSQHARELFEEGLKEEGFVSPPVMTLSYNTLNKHQKLAQAIQQQWKETLGFEVRLDSCDWKLYLHKIASQNYHIARLGWIGEHHDPISYLEAFQSKTHANNETGWEHPRYRELIEASHHELDEQKRLALLDEAEEILIDEMPLIPLYFLDYSYLKQPYVKGVLLSSLGVIDLKRAWIER